VPGKFCTSGSKTNWYGRSTSYEPRNSAPKETYQNGRPSPILLSGSQKSSLPFAWRHKPFQFSSLRSS
jgi:hypothetical protein